MVYLYLSYGITLWGNASKIHLSKPVTIQKNIIIFISSAKYSTHTEPLFKTLNTSIFKLEDIYHRLIVLCVFVLTSHKRSSPNGRTYSLDINLCLYSVS